jgi:N-acetyl-anhydromuramyl-L-alanine amidase AmpD
MSEHSAAARPMRRRSAVIGLALAALAAAACDAEARRGGQARRQVIDMVVIHSTGGPTCDNRTGKAIWVRAGTLDDNIRAIEAHPTLGIHYMIDRDGTLRASVPEDQVAHHVFRVSGRSIAIELINDGDGLDPFPDPQLAALVNLLRDIARRHGIARDGIRRHSELDQALLSCDRSQRRKVDPGAAFPHESILHRVYQPQ